MDWSLGRREREVWSLGSRQRERERDLDWSLGSRQRERERSGLESW